MVGFFLVKQAGATLRRCVEISSHSILAGRRVLRHKTVINTHRVVLGKLNT